MRVIRVVVDIDLRDQIFFVATPLSVLLGLSVFALSLGAFGLIWIDRFSAFVDRLA